MILKEFPKEKVGLFAFVVLSLVGGAVTIWAICSTGLVRFLHSLSRCIHFIILFFVKCGCKTLLDRVS